jgi:hypothetical protein
MVVEPWRQYPHRVLEAVSKKYQRNVAAVEQAVLDVSNAWRNKTSKAVVVAMCRLPSIAQRLFKGEALSDEDLERFVAAVAEDLWPRVQYLVPLLQALKSKRLLLAFDGKKEHFPLFNKGRVADPTLDLVLPIRELAKVRSVVGAFSDSRKGYTEVGVGGKTLDGKNKKKPAKSAKAREVNAIIANALHLSEGGRELVRLAVVRVVPKLLSELGVEFKIDCCTAYEGDSLLQNSIFSVFDGKVVDRSPNSSVAVIATDFDVMTELRARVAAEVFVYLSTATQKRLVLHRPVDAQRFLLRWKAETMEKELSEDELVVRADAPLTWKQVFCVFLLWGVRGTDYELEESGTKGLLYKDGATVWMKVLWLGARAFYGVLRADSKYGREGGFTLHRFRQFLLDEKMKIDKLDKMSFPARVQLAGALKLPRNLHAMLYSMLSRSGINYPLLCDGRRQHVVNGILSMFPPALLVQADVAEWVKFAKTRELPLQPFTAADLHVGKVAGFLAIVLAPQRPRDPKKPPMPLVPHQEGLNFRHATMGGELGGADNSAVKELVKKKKERQAVDCSVPWRRTADANVSDIDNLRAVIAGKGQLPHVPQPRVGVKLVWVVGLGDACLQPKSLLHSTRPYSDVARLFALQLQQPDKSVDVFDDRMLRSASPLQVRGLRRGLWRS